MLAVTVLGMKRVKGDKTQPCRWAAGGTPRAWGLNLCSCAHRVGLLPTVPCGLALGVLRRSA